MTHQDHNNEKSPQTHNAGSWSSHWPQSARSQRDEVFFVLLLACCLTVLKHLDQPAVMIWCYITTLECFQLVWLCLTAQEMLLYLELFKLPQLHIWFICLFTASRHFRVDTGLISLLLACSVLSLLWIMPLSCPSSSLPLCSRLTCFLSD